MSSAAFPVSIDEISVEWLTETLARAGAIDGARVSGIDAEPLGVGRGFASSLARLRLSYDAPGGPRSIVVKTATTDAKTRDLFGQFGLYEREVRFYREIAPAGGVDVPACYFAEIDLATNDFLLLLEDLEHGRVGDQVTGASVDETRAVLEALAAFHARWWSAEGRPELDWLRRPPEQMQNFAKAYRDGLGAFCSAYADQFPALVRIAERLGQVIDEVVAEPPHPPLTIAHGDLRLDNVYFRDAGGVQLIDWQLTSVEQAGVDVARFIAESLPTEVRRAHQDDLLRGYHAALTAHGVSGFSLKRLRGDYREGMIQQLGLSVVAIANLGFDNERGTELSEVMQGRLEATLVDLKVPRLLGTGVWLLRLLNAWRAVRGLPRRLRVRQRS